MSFVCLVVLLAGCTASSEPAADKPGSTVADDQTEVAESESVPTGPMHFSLDDFSIFPEDDDSWTDGEVISCAGQSKGYIYTNRSFTEGTISFEYRFPADLADEVIPNTGLLLLIEPPHKKWPRCIEAQGKQSEAGQLKGNGGVDGLNPQFNDTALASAIRPPGEWNQVNVVISADSVVASWNGEQTASCGLGGLTNGPFGLQSEGNPVEFRNIVFTPAVDLP